MISSTDRAEASSRKAGALEGNAAPAMPSSSGMRVYSVLGAAVMAVTLAACGGGSSGGGDSGGNTPPPPTASCVSQTSSSETGFALGVCANPISAVFQDVATTITPVASPRQYTLSLTFPPGQPASLSGTTSFGDANKTAFGLRDLIGALRGEAFENPPNPGPADSYVAVTSFHKYWDNLTAGANSPTKEFSFIDFGVWERFGTETPDGYFGGFYAPWTSAVNNSWPAAARSYTGWAVGVLSPYRAAGDTRSDRQGVTTYGFSARVSITVDAQGRIVDSQSAISDVQVSFPDPLDTTNTSSKTEGVDIGPLAIRQAAGGASPAAITGDFDVPGGSSGFEAQFFGAPTEAATEIAGRFRLRTSNGVLAVGSFGAFAAP